MFLFRWLKRLIFLAMLAGLAYLASGYVPWHGRPAREHVKAFFQSTQWKEGVKDMRTWAGQLLQIAGKKMEEGVTPSDQKKLDEVFIKDLEKQIQGMASELPTKGRATK